MGNTFSEGKPNPEQKQNTAKEIYSILQNYKEKVFLEGFNSGEVLYPDENIRIRIVNLGVPEKFATPMFLERGFTEKDLLAGITSIITYEFISSNPPIQSLNDEIQLQFLNISNTGKAVVRDSQEPYRRVKLNSFEVDALLCISKVLTISEQILEVFGDIDTVGKYIDLNSKQILYNEGLRKRVYNLGKLDTISQELEYNLYSIDPFTTLIELIEGIKNELEKFKDK